MTSVSNSVRAPWPAAISIPLRFVYGIYAAVLFLAVGLIALLGVLLMPTLPLRRGTARIAARSFFLLAGMPLKLRGTENLPESQCVVVANHASYLDGVVMAAALPPRFGFVIKREMNEVPVAGLLLRRIGSEFVDRFNRHKGGTDARRVLRTAASGHSLVFFPEGTFTPEVGLGKFHTGAFTIAARAARWCPRSFSARGAICQRPAFCRGQVRSRCVTLRRSRCYLSRQALIPRWCYATSRARQFSNS